MDQIEIIAKAFLVWLYNNRNLCLVVDNEEEFRFIELDEAASFASEFVTESFKKSPVT